ncbi:hypothetical protein [Cryobacterium sp. CG_9.6]|uniref:toxin-antitoxin system YwqK family antitoxin n=1 Tax=Cryobacterium sp. CG_9.6 TaxID=2760710 RepID=UPI00247610F6|nr:hypothetical protein [Cryobacterium sp. CG_9.6]MDH6235364.1 antitoxin component YwqK of YwqJK toxin-antitoxin module [Cryobacterium sp. CG_9.6]
MDGEQPVERIEVYETGVTKARGFMLDGELHGEWEWFRLDGSRMRTGSFNRGVQTGLWCTYDRDGRLVKESRFS